MSNPYNIYYDMQRNSFYRVNKETGDSAPSYINGQDLPSFHPNVTGFQSRRRQSNLQTVSPTHSPLPHHKLHKLNFTIPSQGVLAASQFQTKFIQIQTERRSQKCQFQPNSTKYLHQKSLHITNKDELAEKIRLFQTIVDGRVSKNNSPRKDIDGSVEKKGMLDRLCITKNNFDREENSLAEQKKSHHKKTTVKQRGQIKTPSGYRIERQVKREKKFNSLGKNILDLGIGTSQTKPEYKSLERDKARNKNLKKLEREMLRKNSILESNIFGLGQE